MVEMINLNGQVQLFAHSDEMRNTADELTKKMAEDPGPICDMKTFLESQHGLIEAAKVDLEQ